MYNVYYFKRFNVFCFQHSSPHKEPVIRISPLMNPSRYIVVSKVSNCCLLQRANTYFSANKYIEGTELSVPLNSFSVTHFQFYQCTVHPGLYI